MKSLVTRRQALAATSALALAPFAGAAGAQETVGMQLVLAADVSGSVSPARYRTQQDGYLDALGWGEQAMGRHDYGSQQRLDEVYQQRP